MRTVLVEVIVSLPNGTSALVHVIEDMSIDALTFESAVEALDESILGQLARTNDLPRNVLALGRGRERQVRVHSAVIAPNGSRLASLGDNTVEHGDNLLCRQRLSNLYGQAVTGRNPSRIQSIARD